jgi:hypothetical protein
MTPEFLARCKNRVSHLGGHIPRPRYVLIATMVVSVCIGSEVMRESFHNYFDPPCRVTISDPPQGSRVDENGKIGGETELPWGMSLWVFVRRNGVSDLLPLGRGPVSIRAGMWQALVNYAGVTKAGKWQIRVNYTEIADVGSEFQIVPFVVDPWENDRLRHSVTTFEPINGLMSPDLFSGCQLDSAWVTRER